MHRGAAQAIAHKMLDVLERLLHKMHGLRLPRHVPIPPAIARPPLQREHGVEHEPQRSRLCQSAPVLLDGLNKDLSCAKSPNPHFRYS